MDFLRWVSAISGSVWGGVHKYGLIVETGRLFYRVQQHTRLRIVNLMLAAGIIFITSYLKKYRHRFTLEFKHNTMRKTRRIYDRKARKCFRYLDTNLTLSLSVQIRGVSWTMCVCVRSQPFSTHACPYHQQSVCFCWNWIRLLK